MVGPHMLRVESVEYATATSTHFDTRAGRHPFRDLIRHEKRWHKATSMELFRSSFLQGLKVGNNLPALRLGKMRKRRHAAFK